MGLILCFFGRHHWHYEPDNTTYTSPILVHRWCVRCGLLNWWNRRGWWCRTAYRAVKVEK